MLRPTSPWLVLAIPMLACAPSSQVTPPPEPVAQQPREVEVSPARAIVMDAAVSTTPTPSVSASPAPASASHEPAPDFTPVPSSTAGPPTDVLCDYVLAMLVREFPDALAVEDMAKLRVECIADANVERSTIGEAEYAKQASCLLGASTLADMEVCDDEHSSTNSGN